MLTPDASDICQQTARAWWNIQASQLRNYFYGFSDDCWIQRALRRGNHFRKLICFRSRQEMSALRFELFAHRPFNRSINDDCLLRSADRSVVKTRSGQNVLNCFRNIRRALDENRNIARPNAERWLAG